MRIDDNGILREMTPQEQAELESLQGELTQPADEQRLDALEKAVLAMMEDKGHV